MKSALPEGNLDLKRKLNIPKWTQEETPEWLIKRDIKQ